MPDPPPSSVPTTEPPSATSTAPSSTNPTPRPFPTRPLALTLLITSTALMLIPPRKLDLYTFSLGTTWALSAQHLYTPRARPPAILAPERGAFDTNDAAADLARGQDETQEVRGTASRFWRKERLGGEQRRIREEQEREREKLEEVGYAGVIGERILEAFGAKREGDGDGEGEGENKG